MNIYNKELMKFGILFNLVSQNFNLSAVSRRLADNGHGSKTLTDPHESNHWITCTNIPVG